jgi:hypothetical protein
VRQDLTEPGPADRMPHSLSSPSATVELTALFATHVLSPTHSRDSLRNGHLLSMRIQTGGLVEQVGTFPTQRLQSSLWTTATPSTQKNKASIMKASLKQTTDSSTRNSSLPQLQQGLGIRSNTMSTWANARLLSHTPQPSGKK